MSTDPFKQSDVISTYTTPQAVEDGILVSLEDLNPDWKTKSLFTHVTTNLLETHGYLREDGGINLLNMLDLLNQAIHQLKRKMLRFTTEPDRLYELNIETPHGERITVLATMNEIETHHAPHYTLILPEDY